MATVWIPPLMQNLTDGKRTLQANGRTVSELIAELDKTYPGIHARLIEDGNLKPGMAIVVDDVVSNTGLRHELTDASEVHFLPAIRGG